MTTVAELAARLRALPRALQQRVVPLAADGVRNVLIAQLGAGHSPDGKAWKNRKDGARPLPNAAGDALTVSVVNKDTIFVRANFPYAFHNRGARGMPVREVVPTHITAAMSAAIREAVDLVITETLSNG